MDSGERGQRKVAGNWERKYKRCLFLSEEMQQRLFTLFVPCHLTGVLFGLRTVPPNNPCMLCGRVWKMANSVANLSFQIRFCVGRTPPPPQTFDVSSAGHSLQS